MAIAAGVEPRALPRPEPSLLHQVTAMARHELVCILPVEGCAGAPPGVVLHALTRAAADGVSVRLLCWPAALLGAEGRSFLRTAVPGGMHTRAAEAPVRELVLADGRVALVRSRPPAAGRPVRVPPEPALVAGPPAVLAMLREIFVGAWESAVPAAEYRWLVARAHDRLTGQILGSLQAGYKDDVAARKLGLSVRTYRRHVADLLRNMGAETRFQAGVRAAELGLLSAGG